MDYCKQYISQCLTAAANSLRLTTQQIEIVALLKEEILSSPDLANDIQLMKKNTELSTLAIKLSEILNYLENGTIDFFKVSEIFKEHSRNLIRDLSILLDSTNPSNFKCSLDKIKAMNSNYDYSDTKSENRNTNSTLQTDFESDKLKERFILEDENDDEELLLQQYEANILSPIKQFDEFLNRIQSNKYESEEVLYYINMFSNNLSSSKRLGFELIANMHLIIKNSLELIRNRKLNPDKNIVDSIRACLIVIVTIIRKKNIDITNFLNKADLLNRIITDKLL
jgi:hypothetical protein